MSHSFQDYTDAIFPEMMSHPALFSHYHPQKIAILGDKEDRILQEALKHSYILTIGHDNTRLADSRIQQLSNIETYDIIINANPMNLAKLNELYSQINKEGILIQQGDSPFQIAQLKKGISELHSAGFQELQYVHFPEPNSPLGWRMAFMAIKQGRFKRLREKVIFNKSFKTSYYNFDIHKAASVLPEFMRNQDIF